MPGPGLRNAAKQYDIRSFYLDTINIVRDELLGTPGADGRLGLTLKRTACTFTTSKS